MDISEVANHVTSVADLDKIVIVNKVGRPAVRLGWIIALFFERGAALEQRLLANDVLRDFLATFAGQVTHYHPADSERLKKAGALDVAGYYDEQAKVATAKSGRNANDSYGVDVYGFPGGKEVMEPTLLYFATETEAREAPGPSSIVSNVPLPWSADEDWQPLVEMVLRWCSILKPAHGTASPGLVLLQGGGANEIVTSYPLLQRFPGLDYLNVSRWSAAAAEAERGIRTIGWLTVIDDGFVQVLGGKDQIAHTLAATKEVVLHSYPGGLLVQAGPKPVLGDRNRGIMPEAYRPVARLFEPLLMRRFSRGMFHPLPAALDAQQETTKWLHRFE